MGEVYRAHDVRLGRDVAIKVLPQELAADPDRVRRFEQEARAIAALNHPHICQIHDVGPGYLVLEYIEGAPLRGPLPPGEAIRLALQIADALAVAHERGILHRDLKPANILVSTDGRARILDFGLAKVMTSPPDVTGTSEGTVAGTRKGNCSTRVPISSAWAQCCTRWSPGRAPLPATPMRRFSARCCATTPRHSWRRTISIASFDAVWPSDPRHATHRCER
jgi:serine/threonine protein kinase